ncbi:MAG: protein jag [Atopobiaceae bacterium]
MDEDMAEVAEDQELETETNTDDPWAFVRAHYSETKQLTEEETDKIADLAVGYLREILGFFGETQSSIDEYDGDDGELILDINGDNLAVLIGRHGRTLDALQMVLSSLMSSKLKFYYPISVDIEGYKSRRKNKVQGMARSAASRAKRQGGAVSLAPMNAYERRLVHLALADDDQVTTHSEGEEPERRVVITAIK